MQASLRPRRRSRYVSTFIVVGLLLGTLAALWRRQHSLAAWGSDSSHAGLMSRRHALLEEAERWNREAAAAGFSSPDLLTLAGLPANQRMPPPIMPATGQTDILPPPSSACPPAQALECTDEAPPLPDGAADPAMVRLLRQVAVNNEVMLALANGVMICRNVTICWWGGGNILGSWLKTLKYSGVDNFMIAVLDDETEKYLISEENETRFFRPKMDIPDSQKGSHPANQVSTLKYGLVKQILQLGYNVLIADMDLVFLKNPFQHLHRDSDLESQTDGFTERWSYGQFGGIQDKTMGWGGGGLYLQVFTLNVGCIYVRTSRKTVALMERIHSRLMQGPAWDQQLFNEEVWFPSHSNYQGSQVSVRIMDIFQFMNSKIFFKASRKQYLPGKPQPESDYPVMIHMNYHPDKHKRMLCLMSRYIDKVWSACDRFPGGSEPGT